MTLDEMTVVMHNVFSECDKLRDAAHKEYAGEGSDAFNNFNKLATELGIDRKQVLWIYAMKHKDGIANFISGYKSQREDVRGRINDLIVYMTLLRGMIDEENMSKQSEVNDEFRQVGMLPAHAAKYGKFTEAEMDQYLERNKEE